MDLDFILDLIEKGSYIGLFLWLWLGIFGAPIPNEVIVMTIGISASESVLNPVATYFVTYAGILAALTTAYTIGRYIGGPLLPFFQKKKRMAKVIDKSFKVMDKYHSFSLSLSYFLPGLRNFVPFLYGMSKLPFRTFALFAYSGAFVWLTITFNLGFWFGDHKDQIFQTEKDLFMFVCVLACAFLLYRLIVMRRKKKLRSTS